MKKSVIALATILALNSFTAPCYAENSFEKIWNMTTSALNQSAFKDTGKHWGKDYIERLYKEGYVKGSDGYFRPDEALKTEDFLIMVLKVVKPEYKDLKAASGEPYYRPHFEKALEIGLIRDASYDEVPQYEGRMMPRELAVQVIDRALVLMGDKTEADKGLAYKFDDFNIVNDINKTAVLKSYQLGIIKGSNGKFEPKNPLTRAEAAVLITKLLDPAARDKMSFSKNTKDYGEVVNYFLNGFLSQIEQRTVIVEKKPGGVINTGDVDYTEKPIKMNGKLTNWWTDQEFEDMTTGKSAQSGKRYSARIGLPVSNLDVKEWLKLEDVGGNFMPYNGQLFFINIAEKHDGKISRYDVMDKNVKNFNRIAYDLTKYGAQYAEANDLYLQEFIVPDSHIIISLSQNDFISEFGKGYFAFYNNPDSRRESGYLFSPEANFCAESGAIAKQYELLFNQWFVRVYGAEDGPAIFKMYLDYSKGKDRGSKSKTEYKTYKGYQLRFSDSEGVSPCMESTIK